MDTMIPHPDDFHFQKYEQGSSWKQSDRCDHCFTPFSETAEPGSLTEGYTDSQKEVWICRDCFKEREKD